MNQVDVDLYLEMGWNSDSGEYSLINTNLKRTKDVFEEVLGDYISARTGSGKRPEKTKEEGRIQGENRTPFGRRHIFYGIKHRQ